MSQAKLSLELVLDVWIELVMILDFADLQVTVFSFLIASIFL